MDKRISEFYEEHGQLVYYFIMKFCRDEDLAEELTQETFYQAMKTINRYRGECKPSVWLCQIARHVWYQYLEKKKRHRMVPLEQLEMIDQSDPIGELIDREERLLLYKQIRMLDEVMREVIYLRILGELSFSEIGQIMGRTENWARVTFFRAKQKLMERKEEG